MIIKKHLPLIPILSVLLCVLIITYILGAFAFPKNRRLDAVVSTLLPVRSVSSVEHIVINDALYGTQIRLQKNVTTQGHVSWTGTVPNGEVPFAFPVNGVLVDNFLDTLSEKRTLFVFSKTKSSWESQALDDSTALQVRLESGAGLILADLYFGDENYNNKRISLRTARDVTVFQTENNVYPYLTTDASWWADMQLFPTAFSADDIQGLTINNRMVYLRTGIYSSPELYTYARVLISSRGTDIVPFEVLFATLDDTARNAYDRVSLELGSGNTESITIYNAGDTFFIRPNNASYCLAVSAWTYERLMDVSFLSDTPTSTIPSTAP